MPTRILPHLFQEKKAKSFPFTPVGKGGGNKNLTPSQNRFLHAKYLEDALEAVADEEAAQLDYFQIPMQDYLGGICLDIQSFKDIQLTYESLEDQRSHIELLNVRVEDGVVKASIYMPQGKQDFLNKKINEYKDPNKDNKKSKDTSLHGPKNSALIDSIALISRSNLTSFWMDTRQLPTDKNETLSWEVWLRKNAFDYIEQHADKFGITLSKHKLNFPEREICLIKGSFEKLAILQLATKAIAGFRYQDTFPSFFLNTEIFERADWASDLAGRIVAGKMDAPAVCLLDTGVHRTHPLLEKSLAEEDSDTYDPNWRKDAVLSHGTEMAGIALFGDLTAYLESSEEVKLQHRLESIKILPNTGQNIEEHYGYITKESVARAQVNAPNRKRVYCMAVTAEKAIEGKPTAWSSVIDQIASGSNTGENDSGQQLFFISVGNIFPENLIHNDYLDVNDTEEIESPAQAWNAISVGAITDKSFADEESFADWSVVAPIGGISPNSCTSVNWLKSQWPIKPEIVMEGGNLLSDGNLLTNHSDLSVLTTCKDRVFTYSDGTSPATAQAARIGAILQAEYKNLWPETIRGLIIHSADWNETMLGGRRLDDLGVNEKLTLLRRYGYGKPDIDKARWSADNSVCMVIQDSLQPFCISDKGIYVGCNEMNIHALPWPDELLRDLGALSVRLKITLSYFIEPNPSLLPPKGKYAYISHGLRFELKRPLEKDSQFMGRINGALRDDNYDNVDNDSNWQLGVNTRNRGSIISDVWKGSASDLAEQGSIGIFPIGGWWKERKFLRKYDSIARYSLIVTLETDKEDVDIYTPIKNKISVDTVVTI